nr:hypothetical protein CFP56_59342 [Quercus suber]
MIHFSNSINIPFPIRILLREANWFNQRPRFKATVNFNGKELLAASSVRAVKLLPLTIEKSLEIRFVLICWM